MKTEADVKAKLAGLLGNKCLDHTATVFENAPLALLQTEVEAQIRILLRLLDYDGPHDLESLRQRFCRPASRMADPPLAGR